MGIGRSSREGVNNRRLEKAPVHCPCTGWCSMDAVLCLPGDGVVGVFC